MNNNKIIIIDTDLSTNSTLSINNYAVFQQNGVPLAFVVLIFFRFFIAIVGLLFNASLLYVAVSAYNLQGSCNFLIAFNAFCLVIFMPFMSIGAFNHSFVSISTCFWWQFVPMFFGNMFMISTLAIAVDRLFSVLLPTWHSQKNKEFNYLGTVLTVCILYSGCIVYICYSALLHYAGQSTHVLCLNPSDAYQGRIGQILFCLSLLVVTLCIICYVIIWIIVRKNRSKWNGTFTLKILTSLSVLIFVVSFGYFFAILIRILSTFLKIAQFVYVVFASSIVSVIAMAANGPILYIFSTDYQNAFREHLPRLFKAQCNNNTGNSRAATISLVVMGNRQLRVCPTKAGDERAAGQGSGQN